MEKLSRMIDSAVGKKGWQPISPYKKGPHISYMFFINDLIMFFKATPHQAHKVMEVIKEFCNMFGQNLDRAKSRIFFFDNCNSQKFHQISRDCGIQFFTRFGRYLVIPIMHKWVSKATFQYIIDKVQNQLT